MANEFVEKYEKSIIEQFSVGSKTDGVISQGFSWDGARTVVLSSKGVPTLNDYKTTGDNRFGTVEDLADNKTPYVITNAKSFTYTIDAVSDNDTGKLENAGASLQRVMRQVITPYVDTLRIAKAVAGAGHTISAGNITAENIYSLFQQASEHMDDAEVPEDNRVVWVTPAMYNLIKVCDEFTKVSEMTRERAIVNGMVGDLDGFTVIKMPTSRMVEGNPLVFAHKDSIIGPIKLESYDILDKVQGYSGPVVQGLVATDAFVIEELKAGVVAVKAGA